MYFTLLHLFPNLMFRNYHNRKKKINKEWTTKNRLNFAASAAAAAAAAETAARSAAVAAAASGYPTFQYHHVSGSDIKDEPLRVAMMVYVSSHHHRAFQEALVYPYAAYQEALVNHYPAHHMTIGTAAAAAVPATPPNTGKTKRKSNTSSYMRICM
jgi:hypothetical protein